MTKEIIITADGSSSVSIPEMGVTYHSTRGAIQESMHVFIEAGLRFIDTSKSETAVLEMGFGTGLNALLTVAEAEKNQHKFFYETIELHPIEANLVTSLNYCEQLNRPDLQPLFNLMHRCDWNTIVELSPYCSFRKNKISLADFVSHRHFNLIYFDAFAPESQPELWTVEIFKRLYGLMDVGAVLTTYCSKSIVRKAMTEAGLKVEKIPGPPGKREIVRASKFIGIGN